MKKKYTLGYLADFLQAELQGDSKLEIIGIAPLDRPRTGYISFLQDKAKFLPYLKDNPASAVIMRAQDYAGQEQPGNFIWVKDPYVAYAKISALFNDAPEMARGVHSSALIGEGVVLGESVSIGPYVVIGNGVSIGNNTCIGAGCTIGDHTVIGDNCCLCPRVTLYHHTVIGNAALIHSGAVIGSDGFGNANENGNWRKIYQLGRVVVGNEVEIGANTTIDRGALEDTVIGNGVKIDNQVQIGHNVRVGDHTAIAGCVGIAGSTEIGKYCMIGGRVGITGHITIVDRVVITGMSSIGKSITKPGVYASAIPAVPHISWWRVLSRLMQIEKIIERVKNLEKRVYE